MKQLDKYQFDKHNQYPKGYASGIYLPYLLDICQRLGWMFTLETTYRGSVICTITHLENYDLIAQMEDEDGDTDLALACIYHKLIETINKKAQQK